MRAISAADAVSLAVQRTREFLFRPFTWGTYLKLGLVAIITEGLGSNFNSSSHKNVPSGHGPTINSPLDIPPAWIAAAIAAVVLAIIISFLVFYLVTRLRFAYFHCLVHNTREIRPGWFLYKDKAMRFFWLNLAVGFSFLLVVGLIAIPFVSAFWRLFQDYHQGGHLDVALLLSLVLPLIPIILLIALVAMLADLILRDGMLPHFALDDASAGEAWFQVWSRIKAEKKQFIAYALLRIVLPIIAAIGLFILLAIPGLILAGSVAAVEFGIHSTFADATGSSALVGKLLEVFFGVLAFGFALLAGICLGGPVSTAIREYALVFYGGRYKELGDRLYPPSVPTAIA
jgi:hypothetical protein